MRAHTEAWAQVEGDSRTVPMESAAMVGRPREWLVNLDRRGSSTAA